MFGGPDVEGGAIRRKKEREGEDSSGRKDHAITDAFMRPRSKSPPMYPDVMERSCSDSEASVLDFTFTCTLVNAMSFGEL